jgi:hypothetical protein
MSLIAKCHCGATEFAVSEAPESVTSCNCTFCSKRGVLWAYYKPEQLDIRSRREEATYGDYNKHHHCQTCGCGTYSETFDWDVETRQAKGKKIGVNARLFEDFDLDSLPVEKLDGRHQW